MKRGISGVTFSVRNDIRYSIRAIPYYEYDGPLEETLPIKLSLFKEGVSASASPNKLRISGTSNCIALAGVLNIEDEWSAALREIFLTGRHRTEEGIKQLFETFGARSLLTREELYKIIENYKQRRANIFQLKIVEEKKPITLLPEYDHLYDTIDITHTLCQQCSECGVKIYFLGKYPQRDNIVFLCPKCASNF